MKTEVQIRSSKYAELVEQARITGVSIEELVDRALTSFIEHEQYITRMRAKLKAAGR